MPKPISIDKLNTYYSLLNKHLMKRGIRLEMEQRTTERGERYEVKVRTLDGQLWGWMCDKFGGYVVMCAFMMMLNFFVVYEKIEGESIWFKTRQLEQRKHRHELPIR